MKKTYQEKLDKIYEVIGGEYCDVMCDGFKKRGKYPVMIGDVLDWIEKRDDGYGKDCSCLYSGCRCDGYGKL